ELFVEPGASLDPLAHELQALVKHTNSVECVVQGAAEAVLPDRVLGETLGESDHGLSRISEEDLEEIEEQRALVTHAVHRRVEARMHEVEAGGAEQVVVRRKPPDERGEQAAATPIVPVEQTLK